MSKSKAIKGTEKIENTLVKNYIYIYNQKSILPKEFSSRNKLCDWPVIILRLASTCFI